MLTCSSLNHTIFLIRQPAVNNIESFLRVHQVSAVLIQTGDLFTVSPKYCCEENIFNWCIMVLHKHITLIVHSYIPTPKNNIVGNKHFNLALWMQFQSSISL